MARDTGKAQLTARHSQMVLPEVGIDGQRQLVAGRVLVVVGVGTLGPAAAAYLAAAGVGTVGLADGDTVDLSTCIGKSCMTTARSAGPKRSPALGGFRP